MHVYPGTNGLKHEVIYSMKKAIVYLSALITCTRYLRLINRFYIILEFTFKGYLNEIVALVL